MNADQRETIGYTPRCAMDVQSPKKLRPLLARAAVLVAGLVLAALLLEGGLRLGGHHLLEYDGNPRHLNFETPERLPPEYHDGHPCLEPQLKTVPPGRARVLFLGDSVTRQGGIIARLRQLYGASRFEYLNAGFDGYNTVQQVRLYRVSCRTLGAAQVVLTMHNNDLQRSQVFYSRPFSGRLVPRDPDPGLLSSLLLGHSYTYRVLLGQPGVLGVDPATEQAWQRARARTGESLRLLVRLARQDRARLSVVLLPSLRPGALPAAEARSHRLALQLLRQLGIRHFDMQAVFRRAVRDRIVLHVAPGDLLHPSRELAGRFGQRLFEQRLLEGGPLDRP